MAELKPCPFCGSYKFRIEKYGKNKNGCYRIICDSCNAGQLRFNETGDSHERVAYASAEHCMLVIKAAPAVNRWVPCSERLPELKKDHESDCVLCYCDTGAYAFSTLQENLFGQIGFACEKEDDYYHSIGKVIAWMPLPEPPEKE